mgnify:CR=1 FL=1
MISKTIFYLFALANSLCHIFFSSGSVLANQVIILDSSLKNGHSLISIFNINPFKTFSKEITEFSYLFFYLGVLVFVGVVIILYIIWYTKKPMHKELEFPGFRLVNSKNIHHFIPLKSNSQSLEFLEDLDITKGYRLSGNLNRVILTLHNNTYLLEDKNFKNALLINRRRSHRKVLFNDDILDIGEIVLIYRNNLFPEKIIQSELGLTYNQVSQSIKPRGPIQKGVPILSISGSKLEIQLVRNLNTLGTSKVNDIVIESNEVASRHAKIYKVGNFWKIQNLQNHENTFVNGRRIDQRLLKEGDEVAIGDFFFKFNTSKSQIKNQRKLKKETKLSST